MLQSTRMQKKQQPLVIGNWKMNPTSLAEAKKLFVAVRSALVRKDIKVLVAVAAPYIYLSDLARLSPSKRIEISAQDAAIEKIGPHTGEVSAHMLKGLGVSSIILGHSERRAAGETNDIVAAKLLAVLSVGITAVVCVGEKERDVHGNFFGIIEDQLRSALEVVKKNQLPRLVIAYEPIWAIGTGNTATAEDAQEMKLFIHKIVADVFGRSAVSKVRIIYGGSVNAKNAEELLEKGDVDGFLVGGASLKATEFTKIVLIAHNHGQR